MVIRANDQLATESSTIIIIQLRILTLFATFVCRSGLIASYSIVSFRVEEGCPSKKAAVCRQCELSQHSIRLFVILSAFFFILINIKNCNGCSIRVCYMNLAKNIDCMRQILYEAISSFLPVIIHDIYILFVYGHFCIGELTICQC